MRTCIKCKRELPLGMFRDYWYATTNICKDCRSEYNRRVHWLKMRDKGEKRLAEYEVKS